MVAVYIEFIVDVRYARMLLVILLREQANRKFLVLREDEISRLDQS